MEFLYLWKTIDMEENHIRPNDDHGSNCGTITGGNGKFIVESKNVSITTCSLNHFDSGIPDHATYEYPHDTIDFQIGFGSLPNHHCTLASLTYQYPDDPYHDAMVNRFRDAGTGAFSYNKGREFLVTNHIRAVSKCSFGVLDKL